MPDSREDGARPVRQLSQKPLTKQTLADKVAARIEESILSGALSAGEALPPEPEIARQFEVSRAVVRDATRMLAARGLVVAQHGRGVFVTYSPVEAFGDALLLALRRMDASNWDVAQFEQLLYPEVVALAAEHATEADIARIRAAAAGYLEEHGRIADDESFEGEWNRYEAFRRSWGDFLQTVFDATHNQLLSLLARPLVRLRTVRSYRNLPDTHAVLEGRLLASIVDLIAAGDPERARRESRAQIALPPEAIAALRDTPVGEVTHITLSSGSDPSEESS